MNTMSIDSRATVQEYLEGLKEVLDTLPHAQVERFIDSLHDAYEDGKQVFVIGNGGSAATASHMACDLAKTVLGCRPHARTRRFRVIALTDNVPLLTAWSNDAGYQTIFAEQLRNLANAGDVVVVITGSGNSPNVVETVKAANELGLTSLGLLGFDGGTVRELLDRSIVIASDNYGYIEDAHMVLVHLVTSHFKKICGG